VKEENERVVIVFNVLEVDLWISLGFMWEEETPMKGESCWRGIKMIWIEEENGDDVKEEHDDDMDRGGEWR
jgi:hypothetical protein